MHIKTMKNTHYALDVIKVTEVTWIRDKCLEFCQYITHNLKSLQQWFGKNQCDDVQTVQSARVQKNVKVVSQ
jgi:hypothetical protein